MRGKPVGEFQSLLSVQDHPRRCGENLSFFLPFSLSPGSPPQVRGKPSRQTPPKRRCGITPAGAGKTCLFFFHFPFPRDHPRRCGENRPVRRRRRGGVGSPPQVRGKRRRSRWVLNHDRITPAGAGKTKSPCSSVSAHRDHPRRCGENLLNALNTTGFQRITPAGAGKTAGDSRRKSVFKDHPRRCGEN